MKTSQEALAELEKRPHKATEARFRGVLGNAWMVLGDVARGVEELTKSFWLAQAAGDSFGAAQTALGLIYAEGIELKREAPALRWAQDGPLRNWHWARVRRRSANSGPSS